MKNVSILQPAEVYLGDIEGLLDGAEKNGRRRSVRHRETRGGGGLDVRRAGRGDGGNRGKRKIWNFCFQCQDYNELVETT